MAKRLIITERQLGVIKNYLTENNSHENLVELLVNDLNSNYEPMIGIVREEGEYFENAMIKIKVDEDTITPKQLFEYFKKKYKLGDDFTKQVIKDWMLGTIDGNKLSRNVAIN
jgi:hypothetical protein